MLSTILLALALHNVAPLDSAAAIRSQGQYDKALSEIQQLIDTEKSDYVVGWAYSEKGRTLRLKGDFIGALAAEEEALKRHPSDPSGNLYSTALYEKSRNLADLGRVEEAIHAIQLAMSSIKDGDPIRSAQMKNRLGGYYLKKGEAQLAKKTLEETLSAQRALYKTDENREIATTFQRLAEVELALNNLNDAEKMAQTSLSLDQRLIQDPTHPEFGEDFFILGEIAEAKKDIETAKDYYSKALKIYEQRRPHHPQVIEIENRLKRTRESTES